MKEAFAPRAETALKQFRIDYVVFFRDYLACQGRYNESVIFNAKDEADANEQFTEYSYRALRERARERLQIGSQIIRVCVSRITLLPREKSGVAPPPTMLATMSVMPHLEYQDGEPDCFAVSQGRL